VADLDEATLQRKTLTVTLADSSGKAEAFPIKPMSMLCGGRLQAFIGELDPPRAVQRAKELLADSPGLTAETQRQILESAQDEDRSWPPRILFNPPAALAAIVSAEGGSERLVAEILADSRRGTMTFERCREFVGSVDMATFNEIISVAMGGASETPVKPDSCSLLLLGPKGLEGLVRGIVAALGVELSPEQVGVALAAVAGTADRFGTVIPLTIERGAAEVPKGKAAGRSGRSAS
jgi:hypothetical protein